MGQFFHDFLTEAAVFDAVEHSAQHSCGVGDGFLLADLRAGGVKVGHAHAQVTACHFKGAAGTGGRFFKDQSNVFAVEHFMRGAGLLLCLQICRHIEEMPDLGRGKIQ